MKENMVSDADRGALAHRLGRIRECTGRSTPLIAGSIAVRPSSELSEMAWVNAFARRGSLTQDLGMSGSRIGSGLHRGPRCLAIKPIHQLVGLARAGRRGSY